MCFDERFLSCVLMSDGTEALWVNVCMLIQTPSYDALGEERGGQ